jgi:DNA repair protein RecN (Recombination protein N)
MVTVGALAGQLGPLVDLHGQHEHQSLLSPATQLAYLDRYAGEEGHRVLATYQQAWDAWQDAQAELERLEEASRSSAEALAIARHTVHEIEAVDPQPGEYEELEQRLPVLRNGESLAVASQAALDALRGVGGERGALDALADAHRALVGDVGVDARLDGLASQLESLSITADDLAMSLRAYREDVEFDPQALEAALDRLGVLEGLRKRYGPRMQDVFSAGEEASSQLALTENMAERTQVAERALVQGAQALEAAASELARLRARTADEFATALNRSLQELAMEGATVAFSARALSRELWTRSGSVRYELTYRPSETSTPRPLAKIASGGELSRVMLALKTLQKTLTERMTLVFDEVDAGIGGAVALAVAERIRALAAGQQVVVVTHLAQIAAVANRHFVVEKTQEGRVPITVIREVCGEERVAEVARMLAGTTDNVALDHARRLLESAGGA